MADEDEFSEPRTVKRGEVVRFHWVELCGPAFVLVLMLLLLLFIVLAFIQAAAHSTLLESYSIIIYITTLLITNYDDVLTARHRLDQVSRSLSTGITLKRYS